MYKFDKEQLIKESHELGFGDVELDSIFESLNLSEEDTAPIKEAMVLAIRSGAVSLTADHLEAIAESAQKQLETIEENILADYEAKLEEEIDDVLTVVAEEWLKENEQTVNNVVMARLGESLLESLKTTLIEHNVSLPNEKIDIYDEIVAEEAETREMANEIYTKYNELKEELEIIKRDKLIDELSEGLTESHKETFAMLARSLQLNESFEEKAQILSENFRRDIDNAKTKRDKALTEALLGSEDKTRTVKVEEGVEDKKIKGQKLQESAKPLSKREILKQQI